MMRRKSGKHFLAVLPLELHKKLAEAAVQHKTKHGGHLSINRALIVAAYASVKAEMTASERAAVDAFVARM